MINVMPAITNKLQPGLSKIGTKTKSVFFMMIPLGDLEAHHWRWIETIPDGSSVIVLALRLRDLAAKINQGGMLVHLTGMPMSLADIAGILGYQLLRVQYGVTILNRQGIIDGEDSNGWRVIDPVLRQHFNRLLSGPEIDDIRPSLELDAEPTEESKDERRKRLARNRKARFDYRGRWGTEPDEIVYVPKSVTWTVTDGVTDDGNGVVTHGVQDTDIVSNFIVTGSNNITYKTAADCSNAAASPSSTPTTLELNLDIENAINSLPAEHRFDARQVAIAKAEVGSLVIVSNIQRLSSRLSESKSTQISNPCGWLRNAISNDYAANERANRGANSEAKAQYAIQKQKQTEAIERERRTELQWQVQLMQVFESLSEQERKEIEAEAADICQKLGADIPEITMSSVLKIVEARYRPQPV